MTLGELFEDRYTTVYGYMGLGDRYEQHLL